MKHRKNLGTFVSKPSYKPGCVPPESGSTSEDIAKSLACQNILEGAVKGRYSCVHQGSTLGQCDATFMCIYLNSSMPIAFVSPSIYLLIVRGVGS